MDQTVMGKFLLLTHSVLTQRGYQICGDNF
ncbi:uncharacterized protein METZ01_LOCUS128832 [marine metagenome]|uniref:Uncharacterized protein n=1 Tax=marine metagenome TaxID=408172 RepID=A0A381YFW6_9ZZZZ